MFCMERQLRTTMIMTPTQTYSTSEKLADLLGRLEDSFALCHRSYIINLKMVQEITKDSALLCLFNASFASDKACGKYF